MNQTIKYYNQHAHEFNDSTYHIDMEEFYIHFLELVTKNGYILDLGCGSGRDALYFKNLHYQVDAIDFSIKLVELAKKQTQLNIRYGSFYDLESFDQYDGIWACASLLHCERKRLSDVINRIVLALKPNGICYMSFKYGDQSRQVNERFFTDMNESQAQELLSQCNVTIVKQWLTKDKRPERSETWLNIIFKKSRHMFL